MNQKAGVAGKLHSEHQKLGVVLGGNNWKQVLLSFFLLGPAMNCTTLYTIPATMQLCALEWVFH